MNHRFLIRLACLAALVVPLLVFYGSGLRSGRTQIPLDALYADVSPWAQHPPTAPIHVANPVISDQLVQFEPWAEFTRQELAEGRLPTWNPFAAGGAPFAANPQATVFYPLSTPFVVADPNRSPALRAGLHALLAALFTALFLRRVGIGRPAAVGAGLLLALSQFMVAWIGYPLGWTMAWLPAWIYFAERLATDRPPCRATLPFAVVVALTVLAGHPETLWHIAVVTTIYSGVRSLSSRRTGAGWRGPARLVGAGALGAGLAAVLLVPFLEYLLASDAWHGRTGLHGDQGLPGAFLLGGLFPDLFGGPTGTWVHVNFNERAFSVGVIATLAAAGALLHREAWRGPWPVLVGLAAAGTALAFDRGNHLAFVSGLPGFSAAANHRLLGLTVFVLVGLAAVGLDRASRHGFGHRWAVPILGLWAAAAFLLVGPAARLLRPLRHVPPEHLHRASLTALGVAAAAGAIVLVLRRRPRTVVAVLIGLAVFEMGFRGYGLNTVTPASWRNRTPPEISAIRAAAPVRLAGLDNAFQAECNVSHRLPTLDSYDALGVRRFTRLTEGLRPLRPDRLADPRLRLVGVSHVFSAPPLPSVPAGWRHEPCGAGHLYVRESGLDRVFLCGRVETCAEESDLLSRIASPEFEPGSGTLLITGPPPSPRPDRDLRPADRASVIVARPDRIEVEVDLTGAAVLVARDAYFPGWRARIGSLEPEIFPAFGGLRGVALPAGHHRVVFTYEPLSLRIGAIVSGASLILLLLFGVRLARSRRSAPQPSDPKEMSP